MKTLVLALVALTLTSTAGLATAQAPTTAAPTAQTAPNSFADLPLAGARDVTGEGRAFVEVITDRDTYFVQQPIHVRIVFGVERPFLEKEAVQLFQQTLDVPVQLQVPWFDHPAGTVAHNEVTLSTEEPIRARRLTFALGDKVLEGKRLENRAEDGHVFTVLEIETTWLPMQSGKLEIPAAHLRFAYATSFQEEWNGRVPVDRKDAYVRAKPLVLDIQPLPENDRPAGFGGAVGQFAVEAEASPRELDVGDSLKLVLRIAGQGNLEVFDAPRLEGLTGFRVLGQVEETSSGLRTVTYDLSVEDENVRQVPPISLSYFDPAPPSLYKSARTRPIPLVVHGTGPKADAEDEGLGLATFWIGGLVLASIAILVIWVVRRTHKDPRPARVYDAALAFTRRIEEEDADLAQAMLEFLAVMLDCTVPAVVGPRLADRLVAAGIPADLATRTATLLDRLLAARAGGKEPFDNAQSVRTIVDALEKAVQPAETSSAS